MTNLRALDPDQELRPAWLTSELFPFTSRFVDIDGARIHYVDEGNGPILLFLHGAPNWSFFYRQLVSALRDDFRCVALDFPGFGLSPFDDRYPATMPVLAHVLERFNQARFARIVADVVAAYAAPFPDDRYAAGARQFPLLVPTTPDNPASEANRAAWAVLRSFEKPFLTAFSGLDRSSPRS